MLKRFIFDKLSDKKKNRLKIALKVSKLGFKPYFDALILVILVQAFFT